MDASSAQQISEAAHISPPRHNTSIQDHEFGVRSLASEAADKKHAISAENVKNGSKEALAEGIDQQVLEDLTRNSSCDQRGQQLEDTTVHPSEQLGLLPRDTAEKYLTANQDSSELNHELVPESANSGTLADKQKVGSGYIQNGPAYTGMAEIDHAEFAGQPSEDVAKNSNSGQSRPAPEDDREPILGQSGIAPEDAAVNIPLGQLTPLPENRDFKQLELPPDFESHKASTSGGGGRRTSTKSTKGKHALRSSVSSTRVLRSRSQEKSKAPEPVNNLPEHSNGTNEETRRKKKKKKRIKETPVDEFSRIRKHLRYLLHRWTYEQNLIDAYSGEGWKGQSLEKIKPEKELQRAKSEIFRCKLKIRDLFQRLDLSIAKGRFPASLFDSEGQIDSEDVGNALQDKPIFCAKCESTDLPADNDIILCDGACERGFHQFCLEPPLLKDDIPPNDEGWLCPGCDCKVDCIALLNDSQGTNLSILDTWEKVFPEAAKAAAAGNMIDDNLGLPSDDSDDNEYDPDGSEEDEKVEGEESSSESSDESDFYTASEDNGTLPKSKQNLELPSDDSEDDDEYDPDGPDLDDQVKQESSSSDFTSDSDDFGVVFDDTKPSRGSNGERPKVGQKKNLSVNDELSSLLESGRGHEEATPVSGRRHVERLDYKKLYDDTYGNVSSDSSDENWIDDADAPKKRRRPNTEKVASVSPGGRTPVMQGLNARDAKHNQEQSGHTPKRRGRKKINVEGTNNSPDERSSTGRSAYRRLGEAVTQGLLSSFKENQFPERATRENLAKDLGITHHQVRKWFENARWSFRHTSRMESKLAESVPSNSTPPKTSQLDSGVGKVNAGVTLGNSSTVESSRPRSATPRGRKRRIQLETQESDHVLGIEETQRVSATVDLPTTEDLQKNGRSPKSQGVRKRGRPKKSAV